MASAPMRRTMARAVDIEEKLAQPDQLQRPNSPTSFTEVKQFNRHLASYLMKVFQQILETASKPIHQTPPCRGGEYLTLLRLQYRHPNTKWQCLCIPYVGEDEGHIRDQRGMYATSKFFAPSDFEDVNDFQELANYMDDFPSWTVQQGYYAGAECIPCFSRGFVYVRLKASTDEDDE